jgi:hypothetical protein
MKAISRFNAKMCGRLGSSLCMLREDSIGDDRLSDTAPCSIENSLQPVTQQLWNFEIPVRNCGL